MQDPTPIGELLPRLTPVREAERIALIDILRGFALFGILLVNMAMFSTPLALLFTGEHWFQGTLDRAVEAAILLFGQGKFYSLFSMLFGLGFSIQMERASAGGRRPEGFFAQRMFVLFGIGLAHAFLIWYGDILVAYSVVGLLLVLFRQVSDRRLAAWIPMLLVIPSLLFALALAGEPPSPTEQTEAHDAIEQARIAYSGADYAALSLQRARDVTTIWFFTALSAPQFLGLFLIGVLLGRRRILHDFSAHASAARRWFPWLAGAGLAGNLAFVIITRLQPNPMTPSALQVAGQVVQSFTVPALTLSYILAIGLLSAKPAWSRRLELLAPVGRLALSNYLLQSVVCTTLFYGYGVGLYGKVSPSWGLLLTISIFGLQIPASAWWLRRFRSGPAEWLWRSLTYGEPQPMRRRIPEHPEATR